MVSSRLVFLFSICTLISRAFAQPEFRYSYCLDKGNYTSNSTYDTNLNQVLSSLSSNTEIDYGFYNFSYGKIPDKVYSLGLCRGDVNPDICRSCLNNATNLLPLICPNQKEAIGGYDECMLRYSFRSIFNIEETSPTIYLWNPNNVSANYDQFSQDLRILLDSKRVQAAAGGSLRKFAAGNATAPNNQTLYSVVQCTPDLSVQDCSDCLAGAMGEIPNCCDGKQGGRVIKPSCNFRFEVSLFYDPTADNTSSPSLSPPPPSGPSVSPPASNNTPAAKGKESNKSQIVIIVVPIISFVVLIIISFCIYLRVRKPREKPQSESVDEIGRVESLQLGFGTIKVATDDFSDANKLGQGGFGAVYKGKLSDGQVIAVKRLSKNSGQGDLEFKNEVLLVAKLQHRNLVRLLGFCLEGIERLLIYEFVPNGSLDHFIFDPIKRAQLDWARRYKIIGGIARDFGMARLFELDQSVGNTSRIVGTYGYMSPEYAMHGQFSVKSDVFSFGVLVLEIISGQKNNSFQNGENIEDLLSYAWKNWKQGIISNLVDPTLKAGSTTEIMRCIHIGLLCVQENVADRPTMTSILLMLNSYSITLPIPLEPAFFMNSGIESNIRLQWDNDSRVTEPNQSKSSSVQASINEVSITELSPR
ncbi:hypothetical protein CMV_008768 [Castanea mollissima]|uniref:Cysteine-rich receptor-like protein kinase 29 n=1 Tax=Castanea mollissima TaxID=60419 RepID=A0A8J4VZA6_9ROSI|nr:hypothetical protein CMV_008768 [Castanea mollissima]